MTAGNQRIFSRLTSFGKWADVPEKVNEVEVKNSYIKNSLAWSWSSDFQSNFVPPPPRPPFLEGKLIIYGGRVLN